MVTPLTIKFIEQPTLAEQGIAVFAIKQLTWRVYFCL